tara:strand:- start:198 stop:848 length:651 start_codon:yes stop_codon:yes gene_type:complete
VSTVTRRVGHFKGIHLAGPGQLHITQSDRESLTIDAPKHMLPFIESTVENGNLLLGYRSPKIVTLQNWREQVIYHLTIVDISAIVLSGSGSVLAPDLDTDEIELCNEGSGRVVIEELTADSMASTISGSGEILVAGDIESQQLLISGSGTYDAEGLISDFVSLKISGSGSATVAVQHDLDVVITGSGKVHYTGHPEITKQILGSGKITRMKRAKSQ